MMKPSRAKLHHQLTPYLFEKWNVPIRVLIEILLTFGLLSSSPDYCRLGQKH